MNIGGIQIDIFKITGFFGILFLITLIYSGFIFLSENEKRASLVSFVLAFFIASISFILIYAIKNEIIIFIVLIFILCIIALLIFPCKKTNNEYKEPKGFKYDERDIMFSRAELKIGTKLFNEYYEKHPNKKKADDIWRSKSGLLSMDSLKSDTLKFSSANANFIAVDAFVPFIENKNNIIDKKNINKVRLSKYIKQWAKQIGVVSIGITELKDYHLYSIKGRKEKYGQKVINNHPFAIVFTVEMNKYMIDKAPEAETVIESSQQYFNSAAIATQISLFIRQLGYSAKPHFDENYDLICPTVARDAGLGEIGRMGLLMSHEIGPRVRIAAVTTDIPLITDKVEAKPSITEFCKICKKCAYNCPVKAISFNNPKDEYGTKRWTINQESCFSYWNIIGTDCGKCIQVCPYSHPDNFMHNLIRKGINNSKLFAKFALKADDLFYGKKPKHGL